MPSLTYAELAHSRLALSGVIRNVWRAESAGLA
jgi:hypothetical protein